MLFIKRILTRWQEKGGYREVLRIAVPLILSTGAWSIQQFVDRMFLTWYSPESIAAAMPAGILNFTIMSFFIGISSYVGIFIAQYYGAKEHNKIGHILWQGIYVAIIGGVLLLFLSQFSHSIFSFAGHNAEVMKNEIIYFRILCYGGIPAILLSALGSFYSGRGYTWPVMWINFLSTGVNIILDYLLIFGNFSLPELGIKGAAIATDLSALIATLVYIFLIFNKRHNKVYNILSDWKFSFKLFKRLLRFGLPGGIQFFWDISGFTIFIFLMGKLGTISLAATNIAFNINTLAFMPMLGVGIAVSVMVGQYLGENSPECAERSTYSAFHLSIIYMGSIALLYFFAPTIFLLPFSKNADPVHFAPIKNLAIKLLKFVAIYSIFDTMNIVFSSAIKGAGDTKFVMIMIALMSTTILVIPTYFAVVVLKADIFVGWTIVSVYIISLGFSFLRRFKTGKWKKMRVIEVKI